MTRDTGWSRTASGTVVIVGSETGVAVRVVRVATTSGALTVIAEARSDVEATGRAKLSTEGSSTTIVTTSHRVTVRVPEGIDIVVGSMSGRVEITGRPAAVAVVAESGRVSVEHAASVDIRVRSGRVSVGAVDGTCRVSTASGRVTIDRCGDAVVTTRSGRVAIAEAHGPVRAHCVAGGIDIGMAIAADVDADTVSGRIVVSLPAGARPQVLGAKDPSEFEPPFNCVVAARSVSGRVRVTVG